MFPPVQLSIIDQLQLMINLAGSMENQKIPSTSIDMTVHIVHRMIHTGAHEALL